MLGSQQRLSVGDLSNNTDVRKKALDELVKMVKDDNADLLQKYNMGESQIRSIYHYLIESGAGHGLVKAYMYQLGRY